METKQKQPEELDDLSSFYIKMLFDAVVVLSTTVTMNRERVTNEHHTAIQVHKLWSDGDVIY